MIQFVLTPVYIHVSSLDISKSCVHQRVLLMHLVSACQQRMF